MKKTIASVALIASATSASALIFNPEQVETKTYCLGFYESVEGKKFVGDCDEKAANKLYKLEVDENGCTENQVVMTTIKNIEIASCPTFVQL